MVDYLSDDIKKAVDVLRRGGIIAYPVESIFGLGCDPYNEQAVKKILKIKKRTIKCGFVLVACNWEQIYTMISPITQEQFDIIDKTWPGNNTWLFPKKPDLPMWITGDSQRVALRIPDHPVPKLLAQLFHNPVISTSVNIHGETPCKTALEVQRKFNAHVDYIIHRDVGHYKSASTIRDVVTLQVVRH